MDTVDTVVLKKGEFGNDAHNVMFFNITKVATNEECCFTAGRLVHPLL